MNNSLEETLKKRREEVLHKRQADQDTIASLQSEIQRHINKLPRRPKQSHEGLDRKIVELEKQRTITSMPLAQEREILKEISYTKKQKLQLDEYNAIDKLLQQKRATITTLRDGWKVHTTSLGEIDSALAKVRLATKLECKTQDLVTSEFDCPHDKLGVVIGKGGSMIKKIEAATKVSLDVNKDTNIITIEGSPLSIAAARAEIDKLVRTEAVHVDVPKRLLGYLGEKHIPIMKELRAANEGVTIDIVRSSGKIHLIGLPERTEEIKKSILQLNVATKERKLLPNEFPIVIGKKGSTISKLVTTHKVSMDVEKHSGDTTAYVTGPPELVNSTLADIEKMIEENEEVTDQIHVELIFKKIFLHHSGKFIKELQKEVNGTLKEGTEGMSAPQQPNCMLTFDPKHPDKEDAILMVKARRSVLEKATELTKTGLEKFKDLVIKMSADPYIVPRIIGRNGETIKKLTDGKPCFMEVSRTSGDVTLGATNATELENLKKEIDALMEKNALLRMDAANPDMIMAQIREFNRSKIKNEMLALANVDADTKQKCFILRGEKEKLPEAKKMFEEYLAKTFLDELAVTGNDIADLLNGGKGSTIVRLSNEFHAVLRADRDRKVVIIRGEETAVKDAKIRLDQFLHGGNGHSVARVAVTKSIVGGIIGKGGKHRQQLEQKFGVTVQISDSHVVAIRGPEEKVAECKIEVLKMVATARVTQTVPVDDEQKKKLEQNNTIRRIIRETATLITIADGNATIRGYFYDVNDAVAMLNEQLKGEYQSRIELDASHFKRVSASARDPSHFDRIQAETNASVAIDSENGSILVSGKRYNVKKAKEQVFGFLSFVLPGEVEKIKILAPLQATVGQATSLAEIAALVGGATIYLDRDMGAIVVRASDRDMLNRAKEQIRKKVEEAEKLVYVLQLQPADAWIINQIMGKNGSQIQTLQKSSGCTIDVSREKRIISGRGESEEKVSALKVSLSEIVDKAKRENAFIAFPEAAIGAFMGKGGKKLKEFSKTHEVELLRLQKGKYQFRVSGDEDKIVAAQKAIADWLAEWEETRATIQISIEDQFIPAVLGAKGATLKSIESEFECRIDINRDASTLTIRGGKKASRQGALEKVEYIIEKEEEARAEALARKKERDAENAAKAERNEGKNVNKPSSSGALDTRDERRHYDFPTVPVGVKAPAPKKKKGKGNSTVEGGTATGLSLFQMLAADPVPEQ
eukprot:CAMPEP_0113621100 /NCGR_PEP_ID=MMETSP0017_2-20120614/10774_1 /TAXON_ID=2856 /ORGANISM="Cylindrotheca closterium" /LENGTH=1210 /DNA_ID=CAMNT_0000530821 /DNA_START=20 /DNA_END=3652 /DNA_ORIENTATION=+ /assembly_acc=CAM_ASM_000147